MIEDYYHTGYIEDILHRQGYLSINIIDIEMDCEPMPFLSMTFVISSLTVGQHGAINILSIEDEYELCLN